MKWVFLLLLVLTGCSTIKSDSEFQTPNPIQKEWTIPTPNPWLSDPAFEK